MQAPPLIMMNCPGLLSRQVFLIHPQTQVIQHPPEKPVQPVLFLIICWMRATETSQEFWRHYNNTGVTEAVLTWVSTTQHWVLGSVSVASGVSHVTCHYSNYKAFVIKSNSFLTCHSCCNGDCVTLRQRRQAPLACRLEILLVYGSIQRI